MMDRECFVIEGRNSDDTRCPEVCLGIGTVYDYNGRSFPYIQIDGKTVYLIKDVDDLRDSFNTFFDLVKMQQKLEGSR